MTNSQHIENLIPVKAPISHRATAVDIMIMNKVSMARVAKGWSRKNLADAMGISYQQLQKYEKGENRIAASRLLHVSNLLNVDIQYFYRDITMADKTFIRYAAGASKDLGVHSIGEDFMKIKDRQVQKNLTQLVKTIANCQKD
jgi:DNA-binding XRE family transcriptional regulator